MFSKAAKDDAKCRVIAKLVKTYRLPNSAGFGTHFGPPLHDGNQQSSTISQTDQARARDDTEDPVLTQILK